MSIYKAWIIDDDVDMCKAVGLMLVVVGVQARSFRSGVDAGRALLSDPPPDVIFLDLNMPKVDGAEFLRFVRSRYSNEQLPVVMLSVESAETAVYTLLSAGANAFLVKPLDVDELRKVLERVLPGFAGQNFDDIV
ncbi:MAG TPA: response regulator [Anaerolineales bacterium]|jgi:DNA-binding response OmpR family regulator